MGFLIVIAQVHSLISGPGAKAAGAICLIVKTPPPLY